MNFWRFWASEGVLLVLAAANAVMLAVNNRQRRRLKQLTDEITRHGLPPEALAAITRHLVSDIGFNIDLCERILTDLQFLHEKVYNSFRCVLPCPVCGTTIPDVKRVLEQLESIRIDEITRRGD